MSRRNYPGERPPFDATFQAVIVYERPVRFDEVDPAGIVFFARFMNYAHEAMENFFPTSKAATRVSFRRGESAFPPCASKPTSNSATLWRRLRVETSCGKLGNTSATFVHEMRNAANGDLRGRATVVVTVSSAC